jgi:peptidoglycan/xylan/chitin deacetylase (PgdA/CDA1 family)
VLVREGAGTDVLVGTPGVGDSTMATKRVGVGDGARGEVSRLASKMSADRAARITAAPTKTKTRTSFIGIQTNGAKMPSMLSLIKRADQKLSQWYVNRVGERNALIAFYFHGLFRQENEIALNLVDPLEETTIQRFRQFVDYYATQGYTFVAPADILRGLDPAKRYVMITFDDGYANNQLALPILEEFRVPAVIFVATNYIQRGYAFWWDVIYRERARRGTADPAIEREQEFLKTKKFSEIEAYICQQFGADAFKPRGEIDRPLTRAEIQTLAQNKFVHFGNHTRDHAILTLYTESEMQEQIAGAQDDLRVLTGLAPIALAYPNGRHSARVRRIVRDAGVRLAFTVVHQKNYFPIDLHNDNVFQLARFHLSKKRDCLQQCEMIRSDILVYHRVRDWFKRYY